MKRIPRAQEIYKHFKGGLYQVVSIAEHTESGEVLVVYQALYGDFRIYARPLEMFCSEVDHVKYPEVKQKERFELQDTWSSNPDMEQEPKRGMVSAEKQKVEQKPEQISVEPSCLAEKKTVQETEAEYEELDPMLLEFLDADTYEQRLNILAGMHHRITDEMLTTMAIVCDIELEQGELEERYQSLKNCLLTLDKYEISRG